MSLLVHKQAFRLPENCYPTDFGQPENMCQAIYFLIYFC